MVPSSLTARLALAATALLLAGGALATGRVPFVGAVFNAETANHGSAFSGGWIGAASGLSATVAGNGASLTWSPGTHGPVTGQQLWGADGGTGASASCGTYALTHTMASATTASYTDPGTTAMAGHWWCYELVSTSATSWTATAAFTPLRVGLYPVAVDIENGRTAGTLDKNDTIAITFNQNVNTATGTAVCTFGADYILVGDTTCSDYSTDPTTIGTFTGFSVGGGKNSSQERSATTVTSGATVTVTIGQNGKTVTGTGVFTASASITSATGSAAACTAAYCQVTAGGGGF